jgi:two-component system, OmpR family, KDP operon response regulator KdpE
MSKTMGAHILVVDDEPGIERAVRTILDRNGFQVEVAESGEQALESYRRRRPDVVLLDLGLPDMDGLTVLEEIRKLGNTPVVVLSVRGRERDKVAALDSGADDYLTKPFGVDELIARLRVALRHSLGAASMGVAPIFRTGDLEVDLERRMVRVEGAQVRLTPTEYELLKAFVGHPNKVMTDRMLLQEVWGPEYGDEAHYLHVYVGRLRRKLERDPQEPRYVITDPGVGYRLISDND